MAGSAKKGIGIIGYGGFGEFIRAAWDQMENACVTAVCDSDATRAPIDVQFYQTVGPMLADPSVDIVSIATPPSSHKDLAIMAMEAGKHVLIEKPLALSEEEALKIRQVTERTGRVASVDFMLRFNPIVETLKDVIQSGVLGKLRRVDLRNYAMRDQVPEGHWFWDPAVSGRILLEHGVHFFDIARWVVDSPAANVVSLGVELKPGMEDRVFAAVKYANGAVGTFWHSFSRPRELERTSMHFALDLGEIDIFGWIPLEMKLWGWTDKCGMEKLQGLANLVELEEERLDIGKVQSSEFFYNADYAFNARLEITRSKMDVYSDNLRSIMSDLIMAIDDRSHVLRVTLDDAIEAVRTAERATKFSHPDEDYHREEMQPDVLKP